MSVERIYFARIEELEKRNKALTKIISKIEDRAYDWDGIKNEYYGNAIMKIIHPEWQITLQTEGSP